MRRVGYREEQLLRLLRQWLNDLGKAPTYTIIGRELGIERHNAAATVRRLEQRGYLRRVGVGQQRRVGWVSGDDRPNPGNRHDQASQ